MIYHSLKEPATRILCYLLHRCVLIDPFIIYALLIKLLSKLICGHNFHEARFAGKIGVFLTISPTNNA
jgi:hypothetical protein